jgi:hypothetical protein
LTPKPFCRTYMYSPSGLATPICRNGIDASTSCRAD